MDDRDLLIAAAIVRRLPLLTRNVRHFKRLEGFGLELLPGVQQAGDARNEPVELSATRA